MNGGDTASIEGTLDKVTDNLDAIELTAKEVVADSGFPSNAVMVSVKKRGLQSYISEPKRGRQYWIKNKTYANRRRIQGERGKPLLRQWREKVERAFAHLLETGGLRRVHVRGQMEIMKRTVVQGAAFNLGLLMRQSCGVGRQGGFKGRGPSNWYSQGCRAALFCRFPA